MGDKSTSSLEHNLDALASALETYLFYKGKEREINIIVLHIYTRFRALKSFPHEERENASDAQGINEYSI